MDLVNDTPANDAPLGNADSAQPVMRRELATLGELAEAGLAIVLAIKDQAVSPGGPSLDLPALALAFDRVSRAVRMTIALQAKLMADLQKLERGEVAEDSTAARHADGARRERAVDQDGAENESVERAEPRERPEIDSIHRAIRTLPVGELIAMICRDLGLSPDWPVLSEDAGAREAMQRAAIGSFLAGLSRPAPAGFAPSPLKVLGSGPGRHPPDNARPGRRPGNKRPGHFISAAPG